MKSFCIFIGNLNLLCCIVAVFPFVNFLPPFLHWVFLTFLLLYRFFFLTIIDRFRTKILLQFHMLQYLPLSGFPFHSFSVIIFLWAQFPTINVVPLSISLWLMPFVSNKRKLCLHQDNEVIVPYCFLEHLLFLTFTFITVVQID